MSLHEYEIPREVRGYSRHAVDRLLRNFEAKVQQVQADRDGIADRLLDVEAQLDIAKKQLSKAQQSKPNFSGLGSKFEEVLRIAESQAEKMITDAHAEAEQIASEAAADAQRRTRESETRAAQLINDATARAEEIRLSSETHAAEMSSLANKRLTEASDTLASAKREVSRLQAEAESEVVQMRTVAQQQIDEQRAEINRMRGARHRAPPGRGRDRIRPAPRGRPE
jgi:cell division septum initiation protein DivIVA